METESTVLLVTRAHFVGMCTKVRIKVSPKHVHIGANFQKKKKSKCHSPLQYSHVTQHSGTFPVCWIQMHYSSGAYVQQKIFLGGGGEGYKIS